MKQIGTGYLLTAHMKPTRAEHKEAEHHKKVKDPERAVKSRKKAFGHDAVGDPKMESDARHLVKGRVLGGQQKEIDKKEFIQTAAKSDHIVKVAQDALKKANG